MEGRNVGGVALGLIAVAGMVNCLWMLGLGEGNMERRRSV